MPRQLYGGKGIREPPYKGPGRTVATALLCALIVYTESGCQGRRETPKSWGPNQPTGFTVVT